MLFCGDESGDLHEASTFMIDRRVRECALELQDTVLLAKLSAGYLISQEEKYHTTCLINLFELYTESLNMLISWFFALGHLNYARWLPIDVRDMIELDVVTPSTATEFKKGHFAVQQTHHAFSVLAIDHAH
ncbi:hypothetical protein DPMN_174143 [Dreissena polymorpha]|uniref:Uncharacterized protein n=1 Tax=Dreissena polymorpha TaxID=45954 RepID=A0A9D4E2W8_DREPO|nr:hypothetical protein DPMN_174143 [Dreissena polymorpha]